jgi:peptide/nickel transport system ATP-binding protein
MVMYRGRVVEAGPAAEVFGQPAHPYTQALKAAVPDPDNVSAGGAGGKVEPLEVEGGRKAMEEHALSCPGCAFAPRCPSAAERCSREIPLLRATTAGRQVACHQA